MFFVAINWFLLFYLLIIITLYLLIIKRISVNPPGPICFPKIGFYLYIIYKSFVYGSKFNQKALFLHLKETYGDISCFSIGNKRFVLLSSNEIIHEAYILQKDVYSGRPHMNGLELLTNDYKGIIFNDNISWKENKQISLKSLHMLGIGKQTFNEYFINEIKKGCEQIGDHINQPLNVEPILFKALYKVMNYLTFGYEINDSDLEWLEMHNRIRFLSQSDFTIFNVFWQIRSNALIKYFFPIFEKFEKETDFLHQKIKRKLLDKLKINQFKDDNSNCILESYLNSQMKMDEISQCCVDLVLGGTDTVTSFLSASLVLMGRYEYYQNLMKTEIKLLEIEFGSISFEQKRNLHFTQAFIEECHRYFIVIPTFQHRVSKEIDLRGFILRPNDVIIAEQYSLNFNKSVWENPNVFNPFRFINNENGTFQPNKHLIPFGIGKRSCLGEGIGKIEIINTIITILSRFKVSLSEETVNNYEAIITGQSGGIIHAPLPHTLVFSEN